MSEQNKAHCMRIYDEVLSQGKVDAIDEIIAADAVDHSPLPGSTGNPRADLRAFVQMLRAAFPDATFDVRQVIAEGDKVAVYATFEGTHEGDFMGIPASGRRVSMDIMDLLAVSGGLCREHWGVADFGSLIRQLTVPQA